MQFSTYNATQSKSQEARLIRSFRHLNNGALKVFKVHAQLKRDKRFIDMHFKKQQEQELRTIMLDDLFIFGIMGV